MTNLQVPRELVDDREILRSLRAFRKGDFSVRMSADLTGIQGEIAEVFNDIVEMNEAMTREFSRIRDQVGKEGQTNQRVRMPAASGSWEDCVDSVNALIGDLVRPTSEVARVMEGVAKGNLSQTMLLEIDGRPLRGEFFRIGNIVNAMVDQLNAFASEVSRVAREVGTEGKLGGQAQVPGVAGTWKNLTDNVNSMAANLTGQVRNIAEVTTAVARGDLTKKITVDVKGEILELKSTVNTMMDQLNAFASEVSRVAREVGTEGKLGGQAQVPGVAGTWKDLTDNVNLMAANLTGQVRNIAEVTTAVAKGDLTKKITVNVKGEILELKSTVNTMVDQLNAFASEVSRLAHEVGTDGKLGGQAQVPGVAGTWKNLTDNVNSMAANLTGQVRNIAEVTTAVAKGDLTKKITVDVKGEVLELKSTVNTMVDQLNAFASEVSRVAREVGTDGKLGGQAQVPGVAGTWKDLTDNVNAMAANLTDQVRGIATIVTAVAHGDLDHKLVFEAKGEIAALADTINGMIDTLATFGDQVTNVAREVGIEGKLGGQAKVPGAAGLWRALTDNVNRLAANLTTQVRAIAEVATAVTKGDLTRSIMVDAQGEVAALKDNINEMIGNLADTTHKNTEQDWLKTNLANFSRTLQGHRDLVAVSKLILTELAPLVNAQQGVVYTQTVQGGEPRLDLLATYACKPGKDLPKTLRFHENLIGQCAYEKKRILLTNMPPDYIQVRSGLGSAAPLSVIIMPVLFEGEVKAVIELASFKQFSEAHLIFLEQLTESIGIVFNTIEATMWTEDLLKRSQSLTAELQSQQKELKKTNDRLEQQAESLQESEALLKKQQEELQRTNEQLQENAKQLSEQMKQVEYKNKEVELAKAALEEKAEQLALSSRYKSEFLANMSHELRTPLNSLLILAQLLAENVSSNLTPKQIEYAQTIYSAGNDLLALISDILDLAKVESGTVTLSIAAERFSDLEDYVERAFRQIANDKKLGFAISMDRNLPPAILIDAKRLRQILKNLLSNAFKFTAKGTVSLKVAMATSGWSPAHGLLDEAENVVAFSVVDSGIGIAPDKQQIIFEAFQQADGTTSRQFGGTGLGLSISSELARLFGGEIRIQSSLGKGSTFTLYLPLIYQSSDGNGDPAGMAHAQWNASTHAEPADIRKHLLADLTVSEEADPQDDLDSILPGDRVALIVENDTAFAASLLKLVRESGGKGLIASNVHTALAFAKEIAADAITLEMKLGDSEGWTALDLLKQDPETRQIPVNVILVDDGKQRCLQLGTTGFVHKPSCMDTLREALSQVRSCAERDPRNLLVVAGTQARRDTMVEAIAADQLQVTAVGTGKQALEVLEKTGVDCIVIDKSLADMSPTELVRALVQIECAWDVALSIILPAPGTDAAGQGDGNELAELLLLKQVRSREAVLEETALFLGQAFRNLPSKQHRRLLSKIEKAMPKLSGRKVLVVDDDIRNIFALTSALEQPGMIVFNAENGQDAIEVLKRNADIDIILMDLMMPGLDGYDTMRVIRRLKGFGEVPIVGVTAKAMKGDREKCIEAGASDYIAKPVNVEQLLSLMRLRLSK